MNLIWDRYLKERTSAEDKELDGIELRGLEYLTSVQKHMRESLEKLDIPYGWSPKNETISTYPKLNSKSLETMALASLIQD